jgi:PAS domain S-box-containing protein
MNQQPRTRLELLDQLVALANELRDLELRDHKSRPEQIVFEEHASFFLEIFEKARDGIAIIRNGKVVLANRRLCEMLGASSEEILGTGFEQYVHSDLVSQALRDYEEYLAGRTSPLPEKQALRRRDGREVPVQCSAARITFQGQDAVLYLITDVTYVRKAEEELVRLRQYQISLLEHVNIWIDVLNEAGNVVIWNKAAEEISGYPAEDVVGHARIWEYLYPDKAYRDLIAARAMRITEKGESVQGLETEIVTRAGEKKVISWYSRDLKDDAGQAIGSIAIGLDVTSAKKSSEALRRANQALSFAYDQTIEGWSRALDLRDKETEGHSLRVTEMTLRLAELAGMSEAEMVNVRRGALLHDIGKLGVPDAILLKPGELTDEEWLQIRKHPEYGYSLLSGIEYLRPALDIPYCHHEKWDGTGYPRGLKGEEIPLAARLFAVVDIYDATRSDRPYRKAWTSEQAVEHIKSLAGTHLDPRAVEYFLKIADLYR